MKFMTTWTMRENLGTPEERIAGARKVLEAFGRWTWPEGETMLAWVSRADGSGGWALSESDNIYALADAAEKFLPWYSWEITPVMDLGDPRTLEFFIQTSTFHD